jgi:hypothetical protein
MQQPGYITFDITEKAREKRVTEEEIILKYKNEGYIELGRYRGFNNELKITYNITGDMKQTTILDYFSHHSKN